MLEIDGLGYQTALLSVLAMSFSINAFGVVDTARQAIDRLDSAIFLFWAMGRLVGGGCPYDLLWRRRAGGAVDLSGAVD